MTTPLLTQVARSVKGVAGAVGVLVDVELLRRSTTRSTVTGERGFEPPVSAQAQIMGPSLRKVGSDRSLATGRFDVQLFDQYVEAGDKIRWDDEDHLVREVMGVMASDGHPYITMATTD